MRAILTLWFLVAGIVLAEDISPELQRAIEHEQLVRLQRDQAIWDDIPSEYHTRKGVFLLQGEQANQYGFIQCRIVNTSDADIRFIGYSAANPWYRLQTKRKDEWEEVEVGWFCGTGLGVSTIPPGKSVVIKVDTKGLGANLRVGLDLLSIQDKESEAKVTVWSKE